MFLDSLCKASDSTTPGIMHMGAYPCNLSTLSRSWFVFKQVEGSAAYVQIALCCAATLASLAYLPSVYPEVPPAPWFTIPLLLIGCAGSLYCFPPHPSPVLRRLDGRSLTAGTSGMQNSKRLAVPKDQQQQATISGKLLHRRAAEQQEGGASSYRGGVPSVGQRQQLRQQQQQQQAGVSDEQVLVSKLAEQQQQQRDGLFAEQSGVQSAQQQSGLPGSSSSTGSDEPVILAEQLQEALDAGEDGVWAVDRVVQSARQQGQPGDSSSSSSLQVRPAVQQLESCPPSDALPEQAGGVQSVQASSIGSGDRRQQLLHRQRSGSFLNTIYELDAADADPGMLLLASDWTVNDNRMLHASGRVLGLGCISPPLHPQNPSAAEATAATPWVGAPSMQQQTSSAHPAGQTSGGFLAQLMAGNVKGQPMPSGAAGAVTEPEFCAEMLSLDLAGVEHTRAGHAGDGDGDGDGVVSQHGHAVARRSAADRNSEAGRHELMSRVEEALRAGLASVPGRNAQRDCAGVAAVGRGSPYVSKARRMRIVMKIPHMEPHQLSPDFLAKLGVSFQQHPTRPSLLVGAAVQSGCIELVVDLVPLLQDGSVDPDWDPAHAAGFSDPGCWLHHLHVQAPRGTQILTQESGRACHLLSPVCSVWRSSWDDTLSQWVSSKVSPPLTKAPYLLKAPGVLLLLRPGPMVPVPTTSLPMAQAAATSSSAGQAVAATAAGGLLLSGTVCPVTMDGAGGERPTLDVEVHVFGIVPDVCVRSRAGYVESVVVQQRQRQQQQGPVRAAEGSARAVRVSLTGPLPSRGLLTVETKLGWMVNDSMPVLLTGDADLAGEVGQILSSAAREAHERCDLVTDLGSWFDHVDSIALALPPAAAAATAAQPAATQQHPSAAPIPPHSTACLMSDSQVTSLHDSDTTRAHMAQTAVGLLVFAVTNGWPNIARSVLQGLLSTGHTYPWVLAQCTQDLGPAAGGPPATLLQLAAASGCPATLRLALGLGDEGQEDGGGGGGGQGVTAGSAGVEPVGPGDGEVRQRALHTHREGRHTGGALGDSVGRGPRLPGDASELLPALLQEGRLCERLCEGPREPTAAAAAAGGGQQQQGEGSTSLETTTHTPAGKGHSKGAGRQAPSSRIRAAAAPDDAGAVFPEAAYRAWLSARSSVYQNQFLALLLVIMMFVFSRQVFEGQPPEGGTTLASLAFHVVRVGGAWLHPGWWERHSEASNTVWHSLRMVSKVATVVFDSPFGAPPPLPYLMYCDWLLEGILPAFCIQVRPSMTLVFCTLDACLSACLYMQFHVTGSTGLAVLVACAWNLASVLLCIALDTYNRKSFMRTRSNSGSSSSHTRVQGFDKVKSQ
ncbi:MAG: hypothetical protein WDW36_007469 [Sanguina aurantia]